MASIIIGQVCFSIAWPWTRTTPGGYEVWANHGDVANMSLHRQIVGADQKHLPFTSETQPLLKQLCILFKYFPCSQTFRSSFFVRDVHIRHEIRAMSWMLIAISSERASD